MHSTSKGQIKPKADWRAIEQKKKGTNEFSVFAVKSKKPNLIHSFVGRIYGATICLWIYPTFSIHTIKA